MATKHPSSTEATRRHLQHDRDTLTDAVQKTATTPEVDIALDKAFATLSVPKGGRAVRKLAAPERRYWPSANSQRAPSRPSGTKKASR